ncbi:MAG: hypothetical protein RMI32_08550, partial [Candidatus Nitrosocaldus sp.]|nr:hypothetical protein [Candidatus Nitrosocaldus sp.]
TSGGDGGRSSNISTTDPFITETYRHPHHYFDRTNMLARMIIIELAKRGIYKECTYNDLKEAITAVRGGDTRTIKGWIARLCTLKYIRLTNKPFIYEISKLEHIHHPH